MKNKSFIEFQINKEKKIIINFFEPLSDIDGCYDITITFVDGKEQFLMAADIASYLFNELTFFLKKVLNNELLLHESIGDNIGYLLTEYRFHSFNEGLLPQDRFVFDNDGWVGMHYLLWGDALAAWLYNDENAEIILKITPWYKGPYVEDGDYSLYEKFLKEYKTYCVIKLSKDLVKQWLDKAEAVLAILEENTQIQHAATDAMRSLGKD